MMNVFYEHILLIPAIAFVISVFIKWGYSIYKKWKLDLSIALWSWWMPSVHTAVTVSLTMALALKYWVKNDLFALSITFAVITIYDAINIRYEAWLAHSSIWK